jgi:hypothetical protein
MNRLDRAPDLVPWGDVLELLLGMLLLGVAAVAEALAQPAVAVLAALASAAPFGLLAVHEHRAQRWYAVEEQLASPSASPDAGAGPG